MIVLTVAAALLTLGLPRAASAEDAAPLSADAIVTVDEDGFTAKSADDEVVFNIGGRLHLDFGDGSKDTVAYKHFFEDNVLLRRARVETQLTVKDKITAAFQYDFAVPDAPIQDAVIAYTGIDDTLFTLGNFKEPFGLDQLTSDNNLVFIERNLADAFSPGRNTGFAAGTTDGTAWTAVAGVYGGNINAGGLDDNGVAGDVRLTYAPIRSDNQVLHLGIAASFRAFGNGQSASFDTSPEANVSGVNFVDSGDISGVDSRTLLGLEAAYQLDAVRLQGEWTLAHLDRQTGADPDFTGGYIQASWVINGKGPKYTLKPEYGSEFARFGAVQVEDGQRVSKGGFGVFEIGGRLSYIDLNAGNIRGGEERNWTAALNWYPDHNVRIMANYIHADVDGSPKGGDFDADIVEARLQIAY